jgi:hypothetical protein
MTVVWDRPRIVELSSDPAATGPDLALAPLRAAACTYRIALGPRAGQKVLSLQTVPTREPPLTPVPCAT